MHWEIKCPTLAEYTAGCRVTLKSKQQTQAFNMTQGLTTPLLTKGLRRMTRLFEGDILKSIFTEGMGCFELGPMYSRKTNYYSILKSDTVQYISVESQHRELQIPSLAVCPVRN